MNGIAGSSRARATIGEAAQQSRFDRANASEERPMEPSVKADMP